ncbi:MAG: ornithine carbamoyltransferase [Dehalococcoidia bacterium]
MLNNLVKISDCSTNDLNSIISLGIDFKNGKTSNSLKDKSAVLLFDKPSLRTKLSFMIGVQKLGGNPIYFSPEEVGMGVREPVEDVSSVVSRMGDLAIIRTFEQEKIELFEKFSSIPVINALTDDEHPCQALADVMTITETLGTVKDNTITYIGDSNNVAKSLAYAVLSLGGNFNIASPKGYEFNKNTLNYFKKLKSGNFKNFNNVIESVKNSDVVYTDVWASMGQESEQKKRLIDFSEFQITSSVLDNANKNVKFMHDLPAHPGEEIEDGLLYDPRSIVFDQAENRLWAQTGLMDYII